MSQSNAPFNWVALLAWLTSMGLGIFNIVYTRRSFAAANYPPVKLDLESLLTEEGTCLHYKLRNMGTEKAVLKGELTAYLRSPDRKWYSFKRRQYVLHHQKHLEIDPHGQITLPEEAEEAPVTIESFLARHFPELIKPRTTARGRELLLADPNCYFECAVHFQYEPGIVGALTQTLKFQYRIIPSTKNGSSGAARLNFWRIEPME